MGFYLSAPFYFHRAMVLGLAVCFGALAVSCGGILPSKTEVAESYAVPQDTEAVLERLRRIDPGAHGTDHSAFMVLDRGEDALRWRLALLDNAKETIDLQYFIWKNDGAGALLLDRAIRAADRGVRVRLLVDDTVLVGSREGATILSSNPNLEVRVFNPFVGSNTSVVALLFEFWGDFQRLNHRMHNKLMVVDNAAAIIGGRNIGDSYFGLSEDFSFRDMDLVTIGPIATEISEAFDLYWNSEWALPPKTLEIKSRWDNSPEQQRAEAEKARKGYPKILAKIKARIAENGDVLAAFAPRPGERARLAAAFKERARFGRATIAVDTPPTEKGQQAVQVAHQVRELIQTAQSEILVVTPYLIPAEGGIERVRALVQRGVTVRILTNSLASNDVLPSHEGYRVYRAPLVDAGAELHELRADSPSRTYYATPPVELEYLGLHAKVVIVDRKRVFVGTMNFDPRSMIHNTEVGTIVESPELAADLLEAFSRDLQPENSWRVHYDEDGFLQFTSGDESTYLQPARNLGQRFKAWLAPGPIMESQL